MIDRLEETWTAILTGRQFAQSRIYLQVACFNSDIILIEMMIFIFQVIQKSCVY